MISSANNFKHQSTIFYHANSPRFYLWLFIIALACQILFWYKTEKIKSAFELVPAAPNPYLISAISLGDNEFLFRALAMRLQNSGDVFAGFASLKNYDYSHIFDWMKMLDDLNSKSNFVPSLASYYYSQSPKAEDARYLIKYLDEHCEKNIDENWWWLFQAIFIAKKNLADLDLALKLANKLAKNNAKNAPLWTKQMPAFISEEMGDGCMAFGVIEKLIKESESGVRTISVDEMNFMRHFIKERLAKLKNQKFDPRKCLKNL